MKIARTILLVTFAVMANIFTAFFAMPFFLVENTPDFALSVGAAALILAVILSIACIVFGFASMNASSLSPENRKGLGIQVLVIKLLLIPYFLATGALVVLMMLASSLLTISIHLASMGVFLGTATVFLVAVLAVVNTLFILATSSFSISNIVIEYRKKGIMLPATIAFIILQLIPVVDVMSYCCIAFYFRARHKEQRGICSVGEDVRLSPPDA